MDVRDGAADLRVPRRGSRAPRGDPRRHRPVPKHAECSDHRRRARQHRAAVRRAAALVRRRRDAHAELGRLRGQPRLRSDAVRRRHDRRRVRQHRAERHGVRQEVLGAAGVALEPPVERLDPRQPVPRLRRRDVLAEPRPAEHVRRELQPGGTVRPSGRRRAPGLRARVEHRPDDRRNRSGRVATESGVHPRRRASLRHGVGGAAAHLPGPPFDVQLQLLVEPVVRLRQRARARARASPTPTAIPWTRRGRGRASTRATRSSTA